ncbi:MAG: transporter substrate-binding domain-containing protein, partial [Clostridiales bacterium]|nr:transporter substrate-binding domain-containing protein [Clostridiales bacterium]
MILILAFIACLLFGASNFSTASAEDARSGNRTVKAGIFSFEGYHMRDESGRLTGYGVSFLNLVSEYSNLNFKYVGYDKSWEDMQTMLANGEIDVVTSARKTPEREELFDFSLPIGRNRTILSINVDNMDLHRGDYSECDGMKVGLLNGSSQNKSLEGFAADNDFT